MDLDTLAKAVARMRYLQIEAAKYRTSRLVAECKRAEAEVDAYLRSISPAPQGVQQTLFND